MGCVGFVVVLLGFAALTRLFRISAATLFVAGGVSVTTAALTVAIAVVNDVSFTSALLVGVLVVEFVFLIVSLVVQAGFDTRAEVQREDELERLRKAAKRRRTSPEDRRRYRAPD